MLNMRKNLASASAKASRRVVESIIISITVAGLVLLSGCAARHGASVSAGKPAAVGQKADQRSMARSVTRATLSNGLRVIIVRNPLAHVATQQITYFVGSNEAPKGFPGMAHAQEHMMFRGSPGLSANQLAGIYARLGGEMDAQTTQNVTSYFFTVPAADIDVALHIGAIRMAGVDDSESQWQKERGAIEQEVARDLSSPGYVLHTKLLERMFAGTPYAHDALGTKASFDKTTGAMLKAFHDKWYAPNNALLVISGDVEPKSVLTEIKRLYGKLPRKKLPTRPSMHFHPVTAVTYHSKTDEPFGMVLVAFRLPGSRSAQYPAALVAASALAAKQGPLAALAFQGKALAAGFQVQNLPDASIGYAYGLFPPGGNPKIVRQALVAALKKSLKEGIPGNLVAGAKRQVALVSALQANSIPGQAHAWSNVIALEGVNSPAAGGRRVLAVSQPVANAEAYRMLNFKHAVSLVLTPTPGAKPKPFSSSRSGPESFTPTPRHRVQLPDWAASALDKLPQPEPYLHPVVTRLANGLQLIVDPIKGSRVISLYGGIRSNQDMEAPKGQEGAGDVLNALLNYGPTGMTRTQYEAAVNAIGAQIQLGTSFSLKVLPSYFSDGLHLLAQGLLKPRLPQHAFLIQKYLRALEMSGVIQSPPFQFKLAIARALFPPGDPDLRFATAKSIRSLSLAKVQAYYRKVFRPDLTTIVVAGDVVPAKARTLVQQYFGSWQAKGPRPSTAYPAVPLSKPRRIFVPDSARKQDLVTLAETIDVKSGAKSQFALDLANDFLDGGFYASPLYREMREQRGLVYTVSSLFHFGANRSTYKLSYGSYPDKVNEAAQVAAQVLSDLRSHPLSSEQLHLAKAIALRKLELTNQSVSSIAQGWINARERALPLDWNYVKAHRFINLTAVEIQQSMYKYLDPARLSMVVLGTQPPKS